MSAEFAGTLRERIVIERTVTTRTAMGVQSAGWEIVCRCRASVVAEGAGAEREGMALSAMQRFKVSIRTRDGIAIDQRVSWAGHVMMVRQLVEDPRAKERLVLRCEEVRQ